jgi:stalled ribosome rescue protein Dom34
LGIKIDGTQVAIPKEKMGDSSMSAAVVWLDHDHAKIFRLTPGKMGTETLKRASHNDRKDHMKAEEEKYFHELAGKISDAKEILLMGPGTAKKEFMHHLERHHHPSVAKSVIGIETVDHPSENQIMEKARTFFKKFDLYAGE